MVRVSQVLWKDFGSVTNTILTNRYLFCHVTVNRMIEPHSVVPPPAARRGCTRNACKMLASWSMEITPCLNIKVRIPLTAVVEQDQYSSTERCIIKSTTNK